MNRDEYADDSEDSTSGSELTEDGSGFVVGDWLWDKAFARAVDRLTSQRFAIAPEILMEHAGRAVADAVLQLQAESDGHELVIVFAGAGNNGGDALVAARWLLEAGVVVQTFLVTRDLGSGPATPLSPLCQQQLNILTALGHQVTRYSPGALRPFHQCSPIILDGILGIGFQDLIAEDTGVYAALHEARALKDSVIVAIDVPSGIDCDRGDAQEIPLPADITVTFGAKKPVHMLAPARDLCGDIVVADIGFPYAAQEAALSEHRPFLLEPNAEALLGLDPWANLAPSANKYDRGHVLVIGGSPGKTGAPLMTAMAALRTGAGWATVAMPQSALATLAGDVPREITFEALFDGDRLNAISLQRFLEDRRVRAVVCGPGAMSNIFETEALAVLAEFSGDQSGFVLLDAGATHAIVDRLMAIPTSPEHWLLTPHPGEWRKLGPTFDFTPLSASGIRRAHAEAKRLGVTLLYKGATPVLVTGNPATPGFVQAEGSIALARAGSGDVYAGIAAAHGAIGLGTVASALRAQVLLGRAGQLAAHVRGEHAVVAHDIIEHLGRVIDVAADQALT